jgi:hypothetical protein
MDRRTTAPAALALALGLALGPAACSDSDGSEVEIPQRDFETGSLDSLAPDEPPAPAPIEDDAPAVIDQSAPAAEPTEDEREWERERQSQTNFGRTRDRVKTLTNRMQDGTEAEDGLAATTPDEEWVGTGGVVWDMPADWRMAIPAEGRFGQMLVPSPLGAASVAFTRETAPVAEIERRTGSMLVTMTGGRISPRTQNFELLGRSVRTLSMEGTLIDPSAKGGSGETPYQAARAGIVDLGDIRVLVVMWGPEDTIRNNEGVFEAMLRTMRQE